MYTRVVKLFIQGGELMFGLTELGEQMIQNAMQAMDVVVLTKAEADILGDQLVINMANAAFIMTGSSDKAKVPGLILPNKTGLIGR